MIRVLFFILALTNYSFCCIAMASNSYDGLMITTSSVNDNVFYYGEPIHFYFKAINTTDDVKFYHKPSSIANYRLYLKNLTTGQVRKSQRWLPHLRSDEESSPPSSEQAYQPNEMYFVQVLLNSVLSDKKLSEQISYSYNLANKLLAIEKGKYELLVEYQLLPSEKSISTTFTFEVKEVPNDQKAAFQQYVKATAYAGHTYRRGGGGSYSSSHPDSYENFLKEYPNSLYSDHAFVDMVNEVYIYPDQGIDVSINKFRQYTDYFPDIEKTSLKMNYLIHLPFSIKHIPGKDLKRELEVLLEDKLASENSDFSSILINVAKGKYQIEGLKNHAKSPIR